MTVYYLHLTLKYLFSTNGILIVHLLYTCVAIEQSTICVQSNAYMLPFIDSYVSDLGEWYAFLT